MWYIQNIAAVLLNKKNIRYWNSVSIIIAAKYWSYLCFSNAIGRGLKLLWPWYMYVEPTPFFQFEFERGLKIWYLQYKELRYIEPPQIGNSNYRVLNMTTIYWFPNIFNFDCKKDVNYYGSDILHPPPPQFAIPIEWRFKILWPWYNDPSPSNFKFQLEKGFKIIWLRHTEPSPLLLFNSQWRWGSK